MYKATLKIAAPRFIHTSSPRLTETIAQKAQKFQQSHAKLESDPVAAEIQRLTANDKNGEGLNKALELIGKTPTSNQTALRAILMACSRAGYAEGAQHFFDQVVQYNGFAAPDHYHQLLYVYGFRKDTKNFERVLKQMESQGYARDEQTQKLVDSFFPKK